MPTINETIPNKPLSSAELRKIITEDFNLMLDRDGLMASNVGFGRVSYEIVVKLHLDNPTYPEHLMSRKPIFNKAKPEIQEPPIKEPSPDAIVDSTKLERTIDSPNVERVRRGMPIPVEVRDPSTGHMTEKGVKYDKAILSGIPDDKKDKVKISKMPDNTELDDKAKKKWDLEK